MKKGKGNMRGKGQNGSEEQEGGREEMSGGLGARPRERELN